LWPPIFSSSSYLLALGRAYILGFCFYYEDSGIFIYTDRQQIIYTIKSMTYVF
jgi:hypothetical protein